jgi:hypothetical protein
VVLVRCKYFDCQQTHAYATSVSRVISHMKTSPLLLCSLVPDVLQAIVMRSCGGMHSKDTDATASAGDTAAAMRLTCRTLRTAVNHAVKQLIMRATSSEDINQAAKRFPGVHRLFTNNAENTGLHINIARCLTPASVVAGLERFTYVFQRLPAESQSWKSRCHA